MTKPENAGGEADFRKVAEDRFLAYHDASVQRAQASLKALDAKRDLYLTSLESAGGRDAVEGVLGRVAVDMARW